MTTMTKHERSGEATGTRADEPRRLWKPVREGEMKREELVTYSNECVQCQDPSIPLPGDDDYVEEFDLNFIP